MEAIDSRDSMVSIFITCLVPEVYSLYTEGTPHRTTKEVNVRASHVSLCRAEDRHLTLIRRKIIAFPGPGLLWYSAIICTKHKHVPCSVVDTSDSWPFSCVTTHSSHVN
jgi:hypothetical protein